MTNRQEDKHIINTPYDDVFRTLTRKSTRLLIPVINEVFHTNYSLDEPIDRLDDNLSDPGNNLEMDSLLRIKNRTYHIECQSNYDSTMEIRMIEYDFQTSLDTADRDAYGSYTITLPHSVVVYLREHKNIREHLDVEVLFPDGSSHTYRCPVIKVKEYTKEAIFAKKLYFFVPFYLMRYEKELPTIEKNEQRIQSVAKEFLSIAAELNLQVIKGDLLQEDYARIIELSRIILDQLEHKNENKVKEAIFMGGKVLELEVDKYIDAYEKQKLEASIVKQYYIKKKTVSDIAAEFNVTEEYVNSVIVEE